MSEAVVTVPLERPVVLAGLTGRTLVAALLTLFAADNLLLLHFWGVSLPLTVGLICVAATAIWVLCRRISNQLPAVPLQTFAAALLISLALFALGGEGRFFYANVDWQIRDAVLRDMATNPWPFAYDISGTAYFLRAPLGVYLLPALFGENADLALLLFNALRLALILTLGWQLFDSKRDRAIGLAVVLLFSGWDVVGTSLLWLVGAHPSWDHLEAWDWGRQYSSHITQAFWVPHHALAGWTCAVIFLLWRRGLIPVGFFAASIPLVAIWSPLAIMGAVPFAVLAGLAALRARAFDRNDLAVAVLGLAVSLPALVYLQIDAASVGIHLLRTNPLVWLLCVGLEVLPFTGPLLWKADSAATDKPVVRLIQFLLLAMPFFQIGVGSDFQMRASIMPLALLSVLFAQWICRISKEEPLHTGPIIYAVVAITLGAATPMLEVRRALVNGPSPRPLCSLAGAWNKEDGLPVPYSSYLVPVPKLPHSLRDVPVTAGRSDPEKCWERKWVLISEWPSRWQH